jgi:hypothetical protein
MNSRDPHVVPWVNRHTTESWRERVRKRQAAFRLRVDAYCHEHIDSTLCTREEREKGITPAGLQTEPDTDRDSAATASPVVEQDEGHAEAGEISREVTAETGVPSDKGATTKKRRRSTETIAGPEKSGPTNKKQKSVICFEYLSPVVLMLSYQNAVMQNKSKGHDANRFATSSFSTSRNGSRTISTAK